MQSLATACTTNLQLLFAKTVLLRLIPDSDNAWKKAHQRLCMRDRTQSRYICITAQEEVKEEEAVKKHGHWLCVSIQPDGIISWCSMDNMNHTVWNVWWDKTPLPVGICCPLSWSPPMGVEMTDWMIYSNACWTWLSWSFTLDKSSWFSVSSPECIALSQQPSQTHPVSKTIGVRVTHILLLIRQTRDQIATDSDATRPLVCCRLMPEQGWIIHLGNEPWPLT